MEKRTILNVPVEFDRGDFFSLLSLSAGAAIARQNKFGEVIGSDGWNVDLRNRIIKFGEREFPCGIIGSESETDGTWLWGWAHTESGLPENAAAPSRRAKRALADCDEFTAAKFELDELHNGHNLSMVTICAADNDVCYYRCPYGGGAVFVQVGGLPEKVFEPLPLDVLARQLLEVIRSFYCDHRLLTAGLLHINGYDFTAEHDRIVCDNGKLVMKIDFEEAGGLFRIVNISING